MSNIDLALVGTSAAVGALMNGVSKGPFESLAHLWHYVYGYKIDVMVQEKKERHLKNVRLLQEELINEVQRIPIQNIQEPVTSIVGPALEASKFYIEDEEIRKMFSKLIASSMDSSKNNTTHHAFVEIIKMLSPLDAKNLYFMYTIDDGSISRIKMVKNSSGSYQVINNHVFLGNPECNDSALIEASIDNLIRLGLVNVSYIEKKTDDSLYDKHNSNPLYQKYINECEQEKIAFSSALKQLQETRALLDENNNLTTDFDLDKICADLNDLIDRKYEIGYGTISLTMLGKNFCKTCLSD